MSTTQVLHTLLETGLPAAAFALATIGGLIFGKTALPRKWPKWVRIGLIVGAAMLPPFFAEGIDSGSDLRWMVSMVVSVSVGGVVGVFNTRQEDVEPRDLD